MTTVRATCDECGDVELEIEHLTVRVCTDGLPPAYLFNCPDCTLPVSTPTHEAVVDLLVSSGARLEVWSLPAEMFESHEGPVVSHDDVLDFHLALQRPGWFDRVVAITPNLQA